MQSRKIDVGRSGIVLEFGYEYRCRFGPGVSYGRWEEACNQN